MRTFLLQMKSFGYCRQASSLLVCTSNIHSVFSDFLFFFVLPPGITAFSCFKNIFHSCNPFAEPFCLSLVLSLLSASLFHCLVQFSCSSLSNCSRFPFQLPLLFGFFVIVAIISVIIFCRCFNFRPSLSSNQSALLILSFL